MPHKTQTLIVKRAIQAEPAEAYRAFTSALALREWLCDSAQVDARKGGRLYVWWNSGYYAAGQFFAVTPGKKLAFTWRGRGEPDSTQVQITFAAAKDGARVTVAHSGIWSGRKWAEAVGEFKKGWEIALTNLQSVLETGQDLRFVRRPMLGVTTDGFSAAEAAKLGIPVSAGARLAGVVPGMGAAGAGLQKNDVIVSFGGNKITDWDSLGRALGKYQGGDRAQVVFYRGPEKLAATIELSRRPLPDIPASPAALAQALRASHAEVQAARAQCMNGVSEAEASAKPAPGEWSAKETLAHLLAGERDLQYWITSLLTDQDAPEEPDNSNERFSAIASVYTLPAMLEAMRLAEAETAALVAALPPAFTARKARYWRLAYNLLQPATHTHEHLEQIKAAVAAGRNEQPVMENP